MSTVNNNTQISSREMAALEARVVPIKNEPKNLAERVSSVAYSSLALIAKIPMYIIGMACKLVEGVIEITADFVDAIATKITGIYVYYFSPNFQQRIERHAEALVKAHIKYHTDRNENEQKIQRSNLELIRLMVEYAKVPSVATDPFEKRLNKALTMILTALEKKAAGNFYQKTATGRNKTPLKEVVVAEFFEIKEEHKELISKAFLDYIEDQDDVILPLKVGVENDFITKEAAKGVIEEQLPIIFNDALEKGIEHALVATDELFHQAIEHNLLEDADVKEILIPANVEMLTRAAAKGVKASDTDAKIELLDTAKNLVEKRVLTKENETRFLTLASLQLDEAEKEVEEQTLLADQAEELERLEAQAKQRKDAVQKRLSSVHEKFQKNIQRAQAQLAELFSKRASILNKHRTFIEAFDNLKSTTAKNGVVAPIIVNEEQVPEAINLFHSMKKINREIYQKQAELQRRHNNYGEFLERTKGEMHLDDLATLSARQKVLVEELNSLNSKIVEIKARPIG